MRSLWLVCVLGACSVGNADTPPKSVAVDLSAVTLADDCAPLAPPAPAVPAQREKPAAGSSSRPAQPPATMVPGTPSYARQCDQTSMQLMIRAPADLKATTIKIKKVELLDDKGKLLQELTARSPKQWSSGAAAKYTPWDEKLAAGQTVQAMYDLTMPNWDKLTNGRFNAHSKKFQVRVTVAIGSANQTVEKQSITPVRLPAPIPT